MFLELLFVLFPISPFELSFSVCWLFAVFSLFVTINMECQMELNSATTFCLVLSVVIHSVLYCCSRFFLF